MQLLFASDGTDRIMRVDDVTLWWQLPCLQSVSEFASLLPVGRQGGITHITPTSCLPPPGHHTSSKHLFLRPSCPKHPVHDQPTMLLSALEGSLVPCVEQKQFLNLERPQQSKVMTPTSAALPPAGAAWPSKTSARATTRAALAARSCTALSSARRSRCRVDSDATDIFCSREIDSHTHRI